MTMSEQYLLYLSEFETVVCRECKYGITKDGVRLHFRRHHKEVSLRKRQTLEIYAQTLNVRETRNVSTPMEQVTAIGGLMIHKGFKCTSVNCDHLCTTVESMKKHCGDKHSWI